MKKLKRYDLDRFGDRPRMELSENGDYVEYHEVEPLLKELEGLKISIASMKKRGRLPQLTDPELKKGMDELKEKLKDPKEAEAFLKRLGVLKYAGKK